MCGHRGCPHISSAEMIASRVDRQPHRGAQGGVSQAGAVSSRTSRALRRQTRPPNFRGSSDSGGVWWSLDDDRAEDAPVGFAGVEQYPDSVVVEVAKPEADPFDPFDQVVQCLGGPIADLGEVVVANLVEPLV